MRWCALDAGAIIMMTPPMSSQCSSSGRDSSHARKVSIDSGAAVVPIRFSRCWPAWELIMAGRSGHQPAVRSERDLVVEVAALAGARHRGLARRGTRSAEVAVVLARLAARSAAAAIAHGQ